jgi:hypothetical protein
MIPEPHFWFSGPALFLGGSCLFALCAAVFAFRDMISNMQFSALIALAVILAGLTC